MKESSQFEKKIARRSILSGAVMLGGGAAISAAVPSLFASSEPHGERCRFHGNTVKFSKEFLSNKVFQDLALDFDPPTPMGARRGSPTDRPLETGALVQPNGDILFRIDAANAKNVTLKLGMSRDPDRELILTKRDDGIFEGLLSYDDNHTGPVHIDVYVDGALFLYPFMPVYWLASRPCNFVEVPDKETEFMFIKDVPHGSVGREIYWVDALKSWERCMVYTPPGYMKSTREYPVLYLLHGGGENETTWVYNGRVNYILDNLIAEGKAEPFIVILNNGMVRYSDTPDGRRDLAFERMLTESCIPHIDKNYRVKAGKWNRAIAGSSMGCMMTCDIAFRHPELFGNLGLLNGGMYHNSFNTTYVRPYAAVMKDPKKFAQDYKVYFRSSMPAEDHFEFFLEDDKICAEAGIDKLPSHHRIVYPKRTTKWNGWRMGFRDFAQLLR